MIILRHLFWNLDKLFVSKIRYFLFFKSFDIYLLFEHLYLFHPFEIPLIWQQHLSQPLCRNILSGIYIHRNKINMRLKQIYQIMYTHTHTHTVKSHADIESSEHTRKHWQTCSHTNIHTDRQIYTDR